MKSKLKELSRYCCKPNEQEYEFIKTCARLGGVDIYEYSKYDTTRKYMSYANGVIQMSRSSRSSLIPVTQFCDILLKDESEFEWKPKAGEWCAIDWTDGDTDVFMVDQVLENSCVTSIHIRNNIKKECYNSSADFDDSRATFRQPTPEEIQTAIDAWDDRVVIRNMSNVIKADDLKSISALDGYKFRLSEDCKTAELIKSEQ